MYGGTRRERQESQCSSGLSPRVRGNRRERAEGGGGIRSIPACTGEPPWSVGVPSTYRVYPRVYGGTSQSQPGRRQCRGLSPRVRGNRRNGFPGLDIGRSIPACTGEPRFGNSARFNLAVYPRVYGGTDSVRAFVPAHEGLSPRVRGNRAYIAVVGIDARSIPACTGEPPPIVRPVCLVMVYPRVYGGTRYQPPRGITYYGLSPRVRGNRPLRNVLRAVFGSIPACTGEPLPPQRGPAFRQVYPRVYGGTPCAQI